MRGEIRYKGLKVILWVFGLSYIILVLGMTLCLVITFAGCGSEGPTAPRAAKDGRVFVRNETGRPLTVSYFNEELGTIIETVIEAGEEKDVCQALLKGGVEVTVNVKGIAGAKDVNEEDIKVLIDGKVTIIVTDVIHGKIVYQITRT